MGFEIKKFLDLRDYRTEERKSRRKELKTEEFFTPYEIIMELADRIAPEIWADPNKTFLEPAAGNGQLVLYILYRRIVDYCIDWKQALKTTFALELINDNVEELKQRTRILLSNITLDYNEQIANEIMNKNFRCGDFFKWNFEEWKEK